MIYLDSNVFISAALYGDEVGNRARTILKGIRSGGFEACTSTLTFDEVYWVVKKEKGKDSALRIVKAMLRMKNLRYVPVDKEVLWRTYDLLDGNDLGPRDGIHLACALIFGSEIMISEDSDFDKVDLIENVTIEHFRV